MKLFIIVLLTLFAVGRGDLLNDILGGVNTIVQPLDGTLVGNPQFDHAWNAFKNVFNKSYRFVEDLNRRLNFEQAINNITKHNLLADLGLSSYRLGINKYSDLSLNELSNQLMGFKGANDFTNEGSTYSPPPSQAALPLSIDWRKKGYVTPVKDQGQCGSCYTFSSTGALEGQLKKKTGKLVSLSEQQLVDCSQSEGNQGCDGGWMNQAFKYIKKNGGIDTEASYPYLEQVGNCSYSKDGSGGTVTGYVNIPSGDEAALMKAVATVGPVSVAINAGGDFAYYESGIYDPPVCSNTIYDLSHAPLLVGYGTDNGQDYWLVKNSWGESWGIDGYIKMARNKDNKCGIATKASYPLV